MKKRKISVTECANDIIKALPEGVLLTTKAGDKLNSMVIGWGNPGRIWGRPMFVCYVRLSRFTKELLDQNPEFTVSVPLGSRIFRRIRNRPKASWNSRAFSPA